MTHTHLAVLWGVYVAGQAMHILKKANLTVASPKNNLTSFAQFVITRGPALTVRFFLSTMIFWGVLDDPRFIASWFNHAGINFGTEVPMTGPVAGVFGYCADSLLDWATAKIPGLQSELPTTESKPPA